VTHQFVYDALVFFSILYVLFGVDDFLIDIVAWAAGLGPQRISEDALKQLVQSPQKRIAIVIPAWKEGQVLGRMLLGNSKRIEYSNYFFFVGVYPNDPDTVEEAAKAKRWLGNLVPVVNSKPGPTSKGQMLNEVIQHLFEFEKQEGLTFDAILMQDSEDVIHPMSLFVVNDALDRYSFVQTPVFSLDVNRGQFVASTYMDEFAEYHTKDILVREHMGAAIPSAGVGTALSRALLTDLLSTRGSVFNEKCLTEDYELGVNVHASKHRPHFACLYYKDAVSGRREYIATREYFPKSFMRSVRQKTRWSLGICLQSWRNLGWVGNFSNKYFLYRDRKGIFTNAMVVLGYLLFIACIFDSQTFIEIRNHVWLQGLLLANLTLMGNRCFQRMFCVQRVFGIPASLPVPLTWPVASLINAAASLSAVNKDIVARITKTATAWTKTEHELPDFFGEPANDAQPG
jgi:bacteriophage N4 adsorption protein B